MADSPYPSTHDTSLDTEESSEERSKVEFSKDEETLIAKMFNLVGERWSLIAGRIPGRTAEEIQEYWTSTYSTTDHH